MFIRDEDGNPVHWKYDHEPETMGDPLRIAGDWLARNCEAFLFDFNHPGYQKSEFLSWALVHFDALRAGTVPHSLTWDPRVAGVKPPMSPGRPRNAADLGVRYPDAAIEADHIDTSPDVPGEAELYDEAHGEVAEPFMARFVNAEALVVGPKHSALHTGAENPPDLTADPDDPEADEFGMTDHGEANAPEKDGDR